MGEPADPAEGRGREPGAARRVAGGLEPARPGSERPCHVRALVDGDPAVALDEDDDDVLAPQPVEERISGGGPEGVAGRLPGEGLLVLEPGADLADLVDGQGPRTLAVDQVRQVRAGLEDEQTFGRESARDSFGTTSGYALLDGLRGKDVLFVFVAELGGSAVEGSDFSPQVDSVLDEGTRSSGAAGFGARSAYLTSLCSVGSAGSPTPPFSPGSGSTPSSGTTTSSRATV